MYLSISLNRTKFFTSLYTKKCTSASLSAEQSSSPVSTSSRTTPPATMNHEARRANHPSEYRPTPRVPKVIVNNASRKAYWCHLCCCSRLDSSGLDLHYKQAHPTRARNASSRLYTTYTESRHGRAAGRQTGPTTQQHNRRRTRRAAQPRPRTIDNPVLSSPLSWERGISANAPKSLSRKRQQLSEPEYKDAKEGAGGSASEDELEDENGDIQHDA